MLAPRAPKSPPSWPTDGSIRDLSGIVPDIGGEALTPEGLAKIRAVDTGMLPSSTPASASAPASPMSASSSASASTTPTTPPRPALPIPAEPIIFMKATSAIIGPNDDVIIPKNATSRTGKSSSASSSARKPATSTRPTRWTTSPATASSTTSRERDFQTERGGQWDKGKGCDTFGPIGPWLVTRDEVADPQNLGMWLEVDGHRYQNGSTKTMIFGVAQLVSYVSQFMSLQPGDIISTGTPPGVGMGMKPPVCLKAGQTMQLGIDGLGEQPQKVEAYSA